MKLLKTNTSRRWNKQGLLAYLIFMGPFWALADVTWTTGTIAPGDYTSSGVVTISGTVVFSPGNFTFNSLVVSSGTLTLGTAGAPGAVNITASGNVTINTGTTVTATGMGYGANTGTGKGGTGTNGGGGGYGGAGGATATASGGVVYGNGFEPSDLGSGGAGASGGAGGGAIKIVSTGGVITISGTLSANGSNGGSASSGGGSGGSIWLSAPTYGGAGAINANGGNRGGASSGGGGGGRIFISYSTSMSGFTGTYTVNAGTSNVAASPGTVLFSSSSGDVTCGFATFNTTIAATDFPSPLGSVTVQNSCKLGVSGDLAPSAVTVTGAASQLIMNGNLTSSGLVYTTGSGTLIMAGNTGTGLGYTLTAPNVTVDSGAKISADGQGFLSKFGTGAGTTSGIYGGGASYGGVGGNGASGSTGGITYGSPTNPVDLGSGGGGTTGGTGGGAIKIVVSGTLTVNGTISANGNNGSSTGGGGSGGSLLFQVGTFAGTSGNITATGGNRGGTNAGGGGGGRIFVSYTTNSYVGFFSVAGGTTTGTSGTILMGIAGSNDIVCTSGATTSIAASDLPSPLGALSVTGGCALTITGDITPQSVTVTDPTSSLTMNGNVTMATGAVNVLSSSSLYVGGNTITGLGYTITAANITIDSTSLMSANGQGYPATTGTGPGIGSSTGSGGGHGGAGGKSSNNNAGGTYYGNAISPVTLGSGGGLSSGGAGGGAIKLIVSGTLTINGYLSANGNSATSGGGGGGAGGSLWINAGTLAGNGSISAVGGNRFSTNGGGGGGGGRISYSYTTLTYSGIWNVVGGVGSTSGVSGSILLVNQSNGNVTCNTGVTVNVNSSDFPSPLGVLALSNGCVMNITGASAPASVSITTGTLTTNGNLTSTGNITLATAAGLIVGSNIGGGVGYTVTAPNLSIDASSYMNGNGQGYTNETGPGAGAHGSAFTFGGSGAGYGGAGGKSSSNINGGTTYGNMFSPVDLGSGGGDGAWGGGIGGAGGGAMKLVISGTLTVNGSLASNGVTGSTGSAGGGSGGSIWMQVGTLTGSGSITANGGNGLGGDGGGGGGGRISLAYSTSFSGYSGLWAASGGTGNVAGGTGTIVILNSTNNDFSCGAGMNFTFSSSDLPTPLGAINVLNGCKLSFSDSVSPTGATVSGSGSVLTLYGDLSMTTGNLTVSNGGKVVIDGDTTLGVGHAITAVNVSVDVSSSIDANGQGYGPVTGPGAGTSSGFYGGSGGGYGGAGGKNNNITAGGPAYGDAFAPTDLGSGGGNSSSSGGSGGGAMKLVVTGTLNVDGTLAVNGVSAAASSDGGGGSGGSIWLSVGTITGAGSIMANGGNGNAYGGGGGGGRVLLSYGTMTGYSGSWAVSGGTGSNAGAVGSLIFLKNPSQDMTCSGATVLTLNASDFPAGIGAVTIQNGCKVTVTGTFSPKGMTVTGSGSTLTMAGDLIITSANLNLTSGGKLTVTGNTGTGTGYAVVASNISIDASSTIEANTQGYGSNLGTGKGNSGGFNNGGGGGYGGVGGKGTGGSGANGGGTYGSATNPVDLGSGGGSGNSNSGGTGGGAIRLITGTLTVNGTLSSNGGSGGSGAGAGSGGSIWINADTIAGSGYIVAAGGNGVGGGGAGGGGRISYITTTITFPTGNFSVAVGSGGGTPGVGTINSGTTGAATKLAFMTQPSQYVRKSTDFTQQPVVSAQDANGNVVTSYNTAMTIAAYTDATCTTSAGGTLNIDSSTLTYGITWYSGVDYTTPMTTIYLKATSGSLTSACSTAIAVGGGAATQLIYTTQPSVTATAGVNFVQQPVVKAADASGDIDYLHTTSMALAVYSDASCTTPLSGGTLNGSTVTPAQGLGTYTVVRYTKAATIYLRVSSGSLTTACSNAIAVSPGAATVVVFTTEPDTNAVAGVDFGRQPVVVARDAYGNTDTNFSGSITLGAYTSGSCSTTASGTLNDGVLSAVNGVATFTGVDFTRASTVYLRAFSTGLTTDCSTSVTVTAAPATQLVFTTQPSATGVVNVNLKTQPVVTAQDQYGNTDLTYTTAITLGAYYDAACTSVAAGTLTGAATTTAGVAAFSNVRHTDTGTGYLKASSGALTPACSTVISLIQYTPHMFRGY